MPLPLNHSGVVVDCTATPKLVSVVVKGQLMPVELVRHVPFIAKHPFLMLMPPVPYKVDVAPVRFATPPIANCEPGEEVPTPNQPLGLMVRAETEDVARAVEVPIYRVLEIERKVHALLPLEPSVSASWGPVEEAIVSVHMGVVVPIPKEPELGVVKAPVYVVVAGIFPKIRLPMLS